MFGELASDQWLLLGVRGPSHLVEKGNHTREGDNT